LSFPTHEHNLTFHLPRSSFNFFQQCFQSTVFVHFCQIYPYFVFFGAVVKWWCFKNLFLVVISAKKYKYFCMFLYSLLLPNSLVRSNSFFCRYHQIFYTYRLSYSFPNWIPFFFLPVASSTVLNRSDESKHLYFVPDIRVKP